MGGMAKKAEAAGFNDKMLTHQIALIQSMTKRERANPDLMAASRKKRVAAGAGLQVSDLNKLIKQHQQMADMMKKMGKGGMMKQAIAQMMGAKSGVGGGAMPDPSTMSPEAMSELAKGMGQGLNMGGGFPGMPRGLPSGLSGLMKKK